MGPHRKSDSKIPWSFYVKKQLQFNHTDLYLLNNCLRNKINSWVLESLVSTTIKYRETHWSNNGNLVLKHVGYGCILTTHMYHQINVQNWIAGDFSSQQTVTQKEEDNQHIWNPKSIRIYHSARTNEMVDVWRHGNSVVQGNHLNYENLFYTNSLIL